MGPLLLQGGLHNLAEQCTKAIHLVDHLVDQLGHNRVTLPPGNQAGDLVLHMPGPFKGNLVYDRGWLSQVRLVVSVCREGLLGPS